MSKAASYLLSNCTCSSATLDPKLHLTGCAYRVFSEQSTYRIAELEAQLAECQRERDALREALLKIESINWGWDGDCGALSIAEEALAATKENDGE